MIEKYNKIFDDNMGDVGDFFQEYKDHDDLTESFSRRGPIIVPQGTGMSEHTYANEYSGEFIDG